MKKVFVMFTGLLLLVLLLSACAAAGAAPTNTAEVSGLNADYPNALPVEMQLAIGTLKLQDTSDAIDAQTAGQLLPLWEAVRTMTADSSSSPQEVRALYKQIGETMTPAQIQAIAAMQLTQQDIPQVAQQLGLDLGAGRSFNQGARPSGGMPDANAQGQRNFSGGGRGFPGGGGGFGGDGGFPGGGGGGFSGGGGFDRAQQTPNPSLRETAQARFANGGGFNRLSSVWMDAIIQYLQKITQS
ncbi:MAG: hypothetical protein P8Z00_14630 [Anaerolineales bacterium]|jgi:type 1 fimbria pilin